jgi:hypothetical protein
LGDQFLVLGVNVLKVSGKKAFDEALSAIVESTGSDTPKLILCRGSAKQLCGGSTDTCYSRGFCSYRIESSTCLQ